MNKNKINLNYETYKELAENSEKIFRRLLKTILKSSPRDTVIKVLKELKFIKADINPITDKLELMEI